MGHAVRLKLIAKTEKKNFIKHFPMLEAQTEADMKGGTIYS